MITVAFGFHFFKRRTYFLFQKVKQSSAKRIAKQSVVEMSHGTPKTTDTDTTFREKTMDVGIPFEITTESMKNADKAGSKIFSFINLVEHVKNDTLNCFEEKIQKRSILEEVRSKFRINRKNAMSALNIDYLKGHRSSTVDGVFCTACRAESAVASKRNEFKSATGGTAIHGSTESWIPTVDHTFNILDNGFTGMQFI